MTDNGTKKDAKDEGVRGYAFAFDGVVFTPEGRADEIVDTVRHNATLEAAELAAWKQQPERWLVYVPEEARRGVVVTTWLGTALGTILYGSSERRGYLSNDSGRKRQ